MNDRKRSATIAYAAYAFLFCLALAFLFPFSALAHPNEPRLELGSERLNPGAVLDVRGVSFESEVEVTLTLIWGQAQIPLGTVLPNYEGEFTEIIVLPIDLAPGIYTLQATTFDHQIASPPLTIWGNAINTGEEAVEQRDEDDGLLAPMPTYPPAPSPTLLTVGETSSEVSSQMQNDLSSFALPFVAIIIVFSLLGLSFAWMKWRTH